MASDALALWSSATMALNIQFFQLPALSQCSQMIENCKYTLSWKKSALPSVKIRTYAVNQTCQNGSILGRAACIIPVPAQLMKVSRVPMIKTYRFNKVYVYIFLRLSELWCTPEGVYSWNAANFNSSRTNDAYVHRKTLFYVISHRPFFALW